MNGSWSGWGVCGKGSGRSLMELAGAERSPEHREQNMNEGERTLRMKRNCSWITSRGMIG